MWVRSLSEPKASYEAWAKMFGTVVPDDLSTVLDDVEDGRRDLPEHSFHIVEWLRRECKARESKRTEAEHTEEVTRMAHDRTILKNELGTNRGVYAWATKLGQAVRDGRLSKEENAKRLDELCAYVRKPGEFKRPAWMVTR